MKKILLFIFIATQISLFSQKKDRGFLRAQELFDAKRYYKALYEFQSIKTYDEFEENFKNRHLAIIYAKLKNVEQALPYLHKLTSKDKDFLLGKAYYENDSISLAIKILTKAIGIDTLNADLYHYLGKAYCKSKDYEKALINLEKAKSLGVEEVQMELKIGICRYFQNDYIKAITNFEYVKKYFPYDKELSNYLGMSYFKVARKDLAIQTLKMGIDDNIKSTAESAVNLSLVFDDLEQNDSAIFYLKKAIEIDPERVDAYYFLGNKYYDLKMYNQSQFYYEELLKINPDYEKAYSQLANSYFLDKLYDKAIEKYRQSTFFNDKPAEELNYIGICYLQANDVKKARAYFEEALKKDATFYVAYLNLANLSFQEKNYKEAISYLNYATQYKKDDPSVNYLYAKIYLQQENLVEAEYYFKETIRFNSLKKQAYLYLGHLALLRNDPRQANFYYDILLTFLPNHIEGNLYRGIASYLTEEYDNAVKYLNISQQLNPTDYKTKYQLSKALVKQKDFRLALVFLLNLNEENPSDKRLYYLLYTTAKALKMREETKKHKATIKIFEKMKQ